MFPSVKRNNCSLYQNFTIEELIKKSKDRYYSTKFAFISSLSLSFLFFYFLNLRLVYSLSVWKISRSELHNKFEPSSIIWIYQRSRKKILRTSKATFEIRPNFISSFLFILSHFILFWIRKCNNMTFIGS